ncbi:MAG: hypothetical protein AUJ85_05665 [Elusimicrobia bacterium CG1_02_37_114]|nr:MAG: hypothetical protein AUJ85_05665 [Elusimicrobia bacterium CG1_02_37_114]PIV52389.1 MAG: phosphatidylglycerophosphatase A [Elusimicrobia bacterium CG02_land_8_20_14_3_00_37_13]PIZ14098.1 MAG: phosphatidylglycerophosphatase A [Elusimicrobia bacterium CG_4_10_14_0_8_um_filter_37_32]
MNLIIKTLSTGFFTGYIPLAPGTFGTILSAVVYWQLFPKNTTMQIIIVSLSIIIAIIVAGQSEKETGRKDDRRIVIDEIVGFWVCMLFIPHRITFFAAGFLLFRFFDIIKIPPVKKLEKLPGGFGIVLDDIAAGVMTNIVLQILKIFILCRF